MAFFKKISHCYLRFFSKTFTSSFILSRLLRWNTNSEFSHQPCEMGTFIICISPTGKLRHKAAKELSQACTPLEKRGVNPRESGIRAPAPNSSNSSTPPLKCKVEMLIILSRIKWRTPIPFPLVLQTLKVVTLWILDLGWMGRVGLRSEEHIWYFLEFRRDWEKEGGREKMRNSKGRRKDSSSLECLTSDQTHWSFLKFPTGSPFHFLIVIQEKALFYFGILSYKFHLCKILATTIATPAPQRKPRSYPIVVWPFPRLSPWQPLVLCLVGLFTLSFLWLLDFPSIFQTIPLSSLP